MSVLPSRAELLPGTLAMLVLKTLTVGTMHGYAIAQHIQRLSEDVLRVQEGTLYPALQMMEVKGWVRSEWKHGVRARDLGRGPRHAAGLTGGTRR